MVPQNLAQPFGGGRAHGRTVGPRRNHQHATHVHVTGAGVGVGCVGVCGDGRPHVAGPVAVAEVGLVDLDRQGPTDGGRAGQLAHPHRLRGREVGAAVPAGPATRVDAGFADLGSRIRVRQDVAAVGAGRVAEVRDLVDAAVRLSEDVDAVIVLGIAVRQAVPGGDVLGNPDGALRDAGGVRREELHLHAVRGVDAVPEETDDLDVDVVHTGRGPGGAAVGGQGVVHVPGRDVPVGDVVPALLRGLLRISGFVERGFKPVAVFAAGVVRVDVAVTVIVDAVVAVVTAGGDLDVGRIVAVGVLAVRAAVTVVVDAIVAAEVGEADLVGARLAVRVVQVGPAVTVVVEVVLARGGGGLAGVVAGVGDARVRGDAGLVAARGCVVVGAADGQGEQEGDESAHGDSSRLMEGALLWSVGFGFVIHNVHNVET